MTRKSKSKNTKARAPQPCKTNTEQNRFVDRQSNIDNTNKNNNMIIEYKPTKLKPPTRQYDPNAIFGGDSDEDPYDYSDDEDIHSDHDSSFDTGTGYDPGPCSPRPLSQEQPTTEGLRAWNEERGLFFWGRTLITPLSESDITPTYPLFTPSNPVMLGITYPGTYTSLPLEKPPPPPSLPHHDWDSSGASVCESAETEAACCSCEPNSNASADSSVNLAHDYPCTEIHLESPLEFTDVCPPVSRRDGPMEPDADNNTLFPLK